MRPRLPILTLLISAAFGGIPHPASAETYAVVVGINDYKTISDLRFAESDAQLMVDVLTRYAGVREENILALLGSRATRSNIGAAIKGWLAHRAKPSDRALFYFSGHGTFAFDANGDEDDGRDELLCAWDSALRDTTYVRDDDLDRWMGVVDAGDKVIILDCCHAGTGSKRVFLGDNTVKRARLDWRDIQAATPEQEDEAARAIDSAISALSPLSEQRSREAQTDDLVTIEFAACLPSQVSMEVGRYGHGVFTYFLAEGAKGAADVEGNDEVTFGELQTYVSQRLKQNGFEQDPLLRGARSGPSPLRAKTLVAEVISPPPERVLAVVNSSITLNIGASHGVVEGAIYRVYSWEAILAANGVRPAALKPTGRIRVTAASPKQSKAMFANDSFRIDENDAVELYQRPVESDGLVVRVVGDDDARPLPAGFFSSVQRRIDDLPNMRSAEQQDIEDRLLVCSVTPRGGRYAIKVQLADPNLGNADTLFERPASDFSSFDASTRDLMDEATPHLETAFAQKAVASLVNPNSPLRLRMKLGKPDAANGSSGDVVKIGDRISVTLEPNRNCHLLLLNVATDGSLYVLYPNSVIPENLVEARAVTTIPTPGTNWRIRVGGPPGVEIIKAIASTEPMTFGSIDLSELQQQQVFALTAQQSGDVVTTIARDILSNRPVSTWAVETVVFAVEE
jgi:uncharacterized caspase-like protein